MRLVHVSPTFLYAALLLGLAFGCSDDADDGSESTSTTGTSTTGASTTGASTTGTGTTGTGTTGTGTTGTSTSATNTATSSATATSTTGGNSSVPADSSAEAIAAFLEAEGYKESG